MWRAAGAAAVLGALVWSVSGQTGSQTKKDERDLLVLEKEQPQVREPAKELPQVVTAETARLVFFQSPLSSKGLLSEQASEAVDAILRQAGGAQVIRLRAFVAGTGDTRRVRTIVTEKFTQRRLPLPALTVLQAGALPGLGVQIVIEALAVSRRQENPRGLGLAAFRYHSQDGLPMPAAPALRRAIQEWREMAMRAGLDGRDAVRVTCFVSSLEDYLESRKALASEFPKAIQNVVQPLRAHTHPGAACELVLRLRSPEGPPVRFLASGGESRLAGRAGVVLVRAPRLAWGGSQIGFGLEEQDARLALQRLRRAFEEQKVSIEKTLWLSIYALSDRIGDQVWKIAASELGPSNSALGSIISCEDLPALDASFAVDAVALAD